MAIESLESASSKPLFGGGDKDKDAKKRLSVSDVFADDPVAQKSVVGQAAGSARDNLLAFLSRFFSPDAILKFLRLRKNVKKRLREIVIRNSDNGGKEIILNVIWPCPCLILKKKLQAFAGVRADNQRLVFRGRILKDEEDIPEECFKADDFKMAMKSKKKRKQMLVEEQDGFVCQIWLCNVGFSLDKYKVKEKKKRRKSRKDGSIVPNLNGSDSEESYSDDDSDNEVRALSPEEQLARDLEEKENRRIRHEVDLVLKELVTNAEKKVIEEMNNDDDDPKKRHKRFDLQKELDLIQCGEFAPGLRSLGFGERGSFSCVRDEHLSGYPLFIHAKSRKKIIGLANAYKRQLQYEMQQVKSAIGVLNDVAYAKQYTANGKEYFHSKAEMDRYYQDIEENEKNEVMNADKQKVKSKFLKIKAGMQFMNLAKEERPAKPHNEVVEEKITRLTAYNARDHEYNLPTRPSLTSVEINDNYKAERKNAHDRQIKLKEGSWTSTLYDQLQLVDAFGTGIIPRHDLRATLKNMMHGENVHGVDAKVEDILKRSDRVGDGIYHDHKKLVHYTVEELVSSMKAHISGKQLRAQQQRLKKEKEYKESMFYWVKDEKEEKLKAKKVSFYIVGFMYVLSSKFIFIFRSLI